MKKMTLTKLCTREYIEVYPYNMSMDAMKPVLEVSEKGDSNQSPQLQRLARKLEFCL